MMVRVEPSGPELARTLRALLPANARPTFDGMAELFTPDDADISQCGALSSMSAPFNECVTGMELEAAQAILAFIDELLTYPEGGDHIGSLRNSALTCFLENVLPLPPEIRDLVQVGRHTRAFAEQYEPFWLGLPIKRPLWRRLLGR